MYLKIFLVSLIIVLLTFKNFISSHNLTTKQISDKNNIGINQTSAQNIEIKNTKIFPNYTKNRKTESTNKQNNSININAENKTKDSNNKPSSADNLQEQDIKETNNAIFSPNTVSSITISPTPTKIPITTQPPQELEIKSIKNLAPIIECLDSEKNYPCPDRRI